MFEKTRYQLLLSYLAVLTVVLGTFTLTIRFFFIQSLKQQLIEKLTLLGEDESVDLTLKEGNFEIDIDFTSETLIARQQTIEWFDLQGKLIKLQGKETLNLPLSVEKSPQIQTGKIDIIAVTFPAIDKNTNRQVGYVRISQSLKDVNETVQKLDWGLGGGIAIALGLSSIGGIFLTRQAMEPIEQSFQRLKQFTADASHELRSPLMAIKSNAAVALKYKEGIRPKDAEKFEAIASAVSQMTSLTRDLLLLARSDRISSCDEWVRVDLGEILADLVQLYQPSASDREINLKLELIENFYLFGDASQVRRVFTNLIDNALQYTPKGGSIEVTTSLARKQLIVEVKDTGIGIAPEDLTRIFDRLWRADRSRSYWNGGSGLGLAIVKAIVENHGGSITVTSQLSVGSCFSVRLPVPT
ncbi:MAG: ATP-binding protein [Prochloraceae cyanobacterium]|nr:ATP-binding protein [Prochloraceae cyanobacterium]